jgi:hypothetical protein
VCQARANHLTFAPSEAHSKSGSFPPPALPGFVGTTTLSVFRTDRLLATTLEARPPSVPDLPQLLRSLSPHAVLNTPVEPTSAFIGASWSGAAFPDSQAGRLPRLYFRGLLKLHSRYGLRTCSPAFRGLCHGAPASFPFRCPSSYSEPTFNRVGLSPTSDRRRCGALRIEH